MRRGRLRLLVSVEFLCGLGWTALTSGAKRPRLVTLYSPRCIGSVSTYPALDSVQQHCPRFCGQAFPGGGWWETDSLLRDRVSLTYMVVVPRAQALAQRSKKRTCRQRTRQGQYAVPDLLACLASRPDLGGLGSLPLAGFNARHGIGAKRLTTSHEAETTENVEAKRAGRQLAKRTVRQDEQRTSRGCS